MRNLSSWIDWRCLGLVMALAITGCGGGGSEDDEEEEFLSAGGIWLGTITPNGGSAQPFRGLVTEDGDFGMIVSSDTGFLAIGQGDIQGADRFQATATAFTPVGATFPDGTTRATAEFVGTFATGFELSGTYSAGGESGRFNLAYQSLYDRVPSLATLSGVWTLVQPPGAPAVSMAINTNGDLNLSTSTGCTANGRFKIVDTFFNAYAATSTFANCGAPTDGSWRIIGYLSDIPGGTNNRLLVFALSANNAAGRIQAWVK